MASRQQLTPIKGAKVLMVGAGGIGRELLKTLALSGFQDIHIPASMVPQSTWKYDNGHSQVSSSNSMQIERQFQKLFSGGGCL